ncbi:MAG: YHYH protein [Alcanivoracaceae bacterium]|nr:YHYH protein [Alcanivoracaceae bacterium]
MATTRLTSIMIAALALAGCGGSTEDDPAPRSLTCVTPVDNRYASSPLRLAPPAINESSFQGGLYFGPTFSMGSSATLTLSTNITAIILNDPDMFSDTMTVTGKSVPRAPKDGIQIGLGGGGLEIEIVPEPGPCILALDPDNPEFVYIFSDGLPDYITSSFPNSESPAEIVPWQRLLRVPAMRAPADQITALSGNSFDGVLLNGVLIQHRENTCAGTDCGLPYNANPMHAPALYGMDEHHAHTLPDGTYHYHGDPRELYLDDGTLSGIIGLAADGYPIFGPWFDDGGVIRKATSSYRLKSGSVMTEAGEYFYNGTYVEDYEYAAGSGDLDECNGMEIGGKYGYYVTETFPYILNCLRGTPDSSFGVQNQ